jgi:glycosyltransferase XagB
LPENIAPTIWFWFATSHLVGLIGLLLVALLALSPNSHRHLFPTALSMPFYWPLAAIACWRACIEAVFAPFYWAKTDHGQSVQQNSPSG